MQFVAGEGGGGHWLKQRKLERPTPFGVVEHGIISSLPEVLEVCITLLYFRQQTSVSKDLSYFPIKPVFILGPLKKQIHQNQQMKAGRKRIDLHHNQLF